MRALLWLGVLWVALAVTVGASGLAGVLGAALRWAPQLITGRRRLRTLAWRESAAFGVAGTLVAVLVTMVLERTVGLPDQVPTVVWWLGAGVLAGAVSPSGESAAGSAGNTRSPRSV